MANNPEFEMQGIRFVIAGPGAQRHPLPFKLRTASGKWIEVQSSLVTSFEVADVVRELRLLAANIERTAIELEVRPAPSPVGASADQD